MSTAKEPDVRFRKFGTVSFTATTKVNDFIDYLEAGRLMGTRCRDCGLTFFPPRADCCQCLSSRVEWFEVSGSGRLLTYSRLEFAPAGFEGDAPYCIGLLDFGAFKVFGRIAGELPEDRIRVGMQMKAVVNRLSDGRLNYVFVKAENK